MACANYSFLGTNKTASNWHTMDIRLSVNHRRELRGVCTGYFFKKMIKEHAEVEKRSGI